MPLKRKLREFPVTEDALLPVGTSIGVRHFVPGQYVDVTGITRGKGFQVKLLFISIDDEAYTANDMELHVFMTIIFEYM